MLGSTATQLIKDFDPRIPVYGFTVHDDPKTSTEFINAGVRRVFIKPLKEDAVKLVRYGKIYLIITREKKVCLQHTAVYDCVRTVNVCSCIVMSPSIASHTNIFTYFCYFHIYRICYIVTAVALLQFPRLLQRRGGGGECEQQRRRYRRKGATATGTSH